MQNTPKRHLLGVVLSNEPAALSRIIGLITARGWNIEGLTVARIQSAKYKELAQNGGVSRMTLEIIAEDSLIGQVIAQIERLVPVCEVVNITDSPDKVEVDVTLVKALTSDPELQTKIVLMAQLQFRAMSVRTKPDSIVLRFLGQGNAARDFVEAVKAHQVDVETAHSGIVAIV